MLPSEGHIQQNVVNRYLQVCHSNSARFVAKHSNLCITWKDTKKMYIQAQENSHATSVNWFLREKNTLKITKQLIHQREDLSVKYVTTTHPGSVILYIIWKSFIIYKCIVRVFKSILIKYGEWVISPQGVLYFKLRGAFFVHVRH